MRIGLTSLHLSPPSQPEIRKTYTYYYYFNLTRRLRAGMQLCLGWDVVHQIEFGAKQSCFRDLRISKVRNLSNYLTKP